MYPIYPLLALAAALSVNTALEWVSAIGEAAPGAKSWVRRLRGGALFVLAVLSAALGLSRIASNRVNYGGKPHKPFRLTASLVILSILHDLQDT